MNPNLVSLEKSLRLAANGMSMVDFSFEEVEATKRPTPSSVLVSSGSSSQEEVLAHNARSPGCFHSHSQTEGETLPGFISLD